MISSSHRTKYRRGNTLIYVKNCIKAKNRADIVQLSTDKIFEVSCVELDDYMVLVVYRSPSSKLEQFIKKLDECLMKITNKNNKNIIICGDFNLDFPTDKTKTHDLTDLMNSYLLKQQIFEHTRVTITSSSCIDNIFTDCNVFKAKVMFGIKSDHKAQKIVIDSEKEVINQHRYIPFTITRRFTNDSNINELKTALFDSSVLKAANLNFKLFFSEFIRLCNTYIPVTQRKCMPRQACKSWITQGIIQSRKKLFSLYEHIQFSNSDSLREYTRMYSKIYKRVCVQAKQLYLKERILHSKNKIKTSWEIIRELSNKNKSKTIDDIILKTDDDVILREKLDIANHFNNFFNNVAADATKSLPVNVNNALSYIGRYSAKQVKTKDIFYLTTPGEVANTIKNLKPKKSNDLWNITSTLIKQLKHELAYPVTKIVNDAFQSGEFPNLLKIAKILPLHKKEDVQDACNYRPISILPTLSKIFERIMYNRLSDYFEYNKVLNDKQFGFRKKRSTVQALTTIVGWILKGLDEKESALGVFCDLSKAFDCVHHGILLAKLDHYGIQGTDLKLCKSYLENRKQIVEIKGEKSSEQKIKMGVPQGSILGPLFFLIYINDLTVCVPQGLKMVMFADDITVVINCKNKTVVIDKLRNLLTNLETWFNSNNLLLNLNKTNLINFSLDTHCRQNTLELKQFIKEKALVLLDNTKMLGLEMESNLTWKNHINTLAKKLSSACYAIKKIKEYCGKEAARTVYFAYSHSYMMYGLLVWGTAAEAGRIFILQKRAIRFLYGLKRRESGITA